MNFTCLYYFAEACKDLNFTFTARRLFTSQQNLSNQIRKLERYYHTQLFERRPHLQLTESGKRLLQFANQTLAQERNLKHLLDDYENEARGLLRLGISTPRSRIIIPPILKLFNQKFPLVQVELVNHDSAKLIPLVEEGAVDFAIGVFPQLPRNLVCTPLWHDRLFFTVSDTLLLKRYGKDQINELKESCLLERSIRPFASLPIIMPSYNNTIARSILDCYSELNIQPNILLQTEYPQLYIPLCFDGVAAGFFVQLSLIYESEQRVNGAEMNYFPIYLNGESLYLNTSGIHRKDLPLTRYKREFLQIAQEYFQNVMHKRVLQQL